MLEPVIVKKEYKFPITGTVINWESFSGDPNDPVRPVVPVVSGNYDYMTYLKSIDVDEGSAVIEIDAEEDYHAALAIKIGNKSILEMVESEQIFHLKRGLNDPVPKVQLKFNVDEL